MSQQSSIRQIIKTKKKTELNFGTLTQKKYDFFLNIFMVASFSVIPEDDTHFVILYAIFSGV